MARPHPHCPWCGHRFKPEAPWPRTCASCTHISYLNPLPVGVVLIPIHPRGILTIRRGIEPGYNTLALPGGFIEAHETWQVASAREVFEETNIVLDPTTLQTFRVLSDKHYLLIFSLAPAQNLQDLPPFIANEETLERCIITKPQNLAFDLHTQAVHAWFNDHKQP